MKKIFQLVIILITLFSFQYSFAGGSGSSGYVNPPAGMPACAPAGAPAQTACGATAICDLNGYCGRTESSYTADYWSQLNSEFCGSIENNAFLTFTATASTITFDAYVYNCNGDEAIQVFLFEAANCSSGAVNDLACVDEMYARNTPYNVSANGLVPGNNYYIMIDGFAGDVCSYTFVATSGVAQPIGTDIVDSVICTGENIVVTANGGFGSYTWSGAQGLSATTGNTVTITPPAIPGTYLYKIESTGTVTMCPSNLEHEFNIVVVQSTTSDFTQMGPYCPGDAFTLPTTSINNITGSWSPAPNSAQTTWYYFTPDAGQCAARDSMEIEILSPPSVNAGLDVIACKDKPITLTATGAATYTWNHGVQNGVPFIPTQNSYTVTGTSAQGCIATDEVRVTIEDSLVPSFIPSVLSGCAPLEVFFTSGVDSTYLHEWTFGAGSSTQGPRTSYTFTGSGCFDISLKLTSPNGCIGTTRLDSLICLFPNPTASFIPQPGQLDLLDPKSIMINNSTNAVSYTWNFGDGSPLDNTSNPIHVFPSDQAGSYLVTLYAYNQMGCVDSIKSTVRVVEDVVFYIPNAFTPDGDEFNNIFKPIFYSGYDPHDYYLRVFNRWGELIFESLDVNFGWDGVYLQTGKLSQEGTYVWDIEFKTLQNDERKKYTGHFTLLK